MLYADFKKNEHHPIHLHYLFVRDALRCYEGTDRMVTILKTMRECLIAKGVVFRFGTRVDRLILQAGGAIAAGDEGAFAVQGVECSFLAEDAYGTGRCRHVRSEKGLGATTNSTTIPNSEVPSTISKDSAERSRVTEVIEADHVVLAVGHSARALYGTLVKRMTALIKINEEANQILILLTLHHNRSTRRRRCSSRAQRVCRRISHRAPAGMYCSAHLSERGHRFGFGLPSIRICVECLHVLILVAFFSLKNSLHHRA